MGILSTRELRFAVPPHHPRRALTCAGNFDNPEWRFELKYDGFRAVAYVEDSVCSLVSRKGNTFRTWPGLCDAVAATVRGHDAVLDGEVVCLDGSGRPQFNSLLFRRAEPCFAAFDLLWLDDRDLRGLPLIERKRLLREIIAPDAASILYVSHIEGRGVDLFRAVCEADLEGVVAKLASAPYGTEPPSWIKVKNPFYSQAKGRWEFLEAARTRKSRSEPPRCVEKRIG